jgi:hypothetical protein
VRERGLTCFFDSVLNVPVNLDAFLFCIFVREMCDLSLYLYVVADPMNLYLVVQIVIFYLFSNFFVRCSSSLS